jgi:hypothetical protein
MNDCPECDGTGSDPECDGEGCSYCDQTGNCQHCCGTGNDPEVWQARSN